MQMQKKAKNLHRSLFGRFRRYMEYKVIKFNKILILADQYYPSTQRCSHCGHVKTGDDKIGLDGNKNTEQNTMNIFVTHVALLLTVIKTQ